MKLTKIVQIATGGLDSNFSYLAIAPSGDALLVDPCGDAEKIRAAVEQARPGLKPRCILLTHGHRDHFDALDEVKAFFKAPLAAHALCKAVASDIALEDEATIAFGQLRIKCLHTPGHSPDSVCYVLLDNSAIFTGDTLFIDCCGYCEARAMFKTMREKLFPLPDELTVCPGHDYGHVPMESLGAQKRSNPYLRIDSFEEFKRELEKL